MNGIGTRIVENPSKNRFFLEVVAYILDKFSKLVNIDRLGSWAIETIKIDLTFPELPGEFHNFRIVQISDLHFGSWLTKEFLDHVIDQVNQLEPDMVVITGDFVSFFPAKYSQDLVSCLKRLRPKDLTLAVLGNHDHWSHAEEVRQILSLCQIKELNNQVQTLHRSPAQIYVAGIDDYLCELDDLERITSLIPAAGFAILLAHEPDFAELSAPTGRFNIQLSGHSHGSQIKIPAISRFFLPSEGRKYPNGLYKIKHMYLYTNRGIGTAWLNLRYNCPPEITLFQLKSNITPDIQ